MANMLELSDEDVDLEALVAGAASGEEADESEVVAEPTIAGRDADEARDGEDTAATEAGDDEDETAGEDAGEEQQGDEAQAAPPVVEQEVERRVRERLNAEVQTAISRLQSKLDRRYQEAVNERGDLETDLVALQRGLDQALAALAEYDEDAVSALRSSQQLALTRARNERLTARQQIQAAEQQRAAYYDRFNREHAATPVDPADPELVELFYRQFEPGISQREHAALKKAYDARFALLYHQAAARQAPQPVAEKKPDPVERKVAATREREKTRGPQVTGTKGGATPRPNVTFDDAMRNMVEAGRRLKLEF